MAASPSHDDQRDEVQRPRDDDGSADDDVANGAKVRELPGQVFKRAKIADEDDQGDPTAAIVAELRDALSSVVARVDLAPDEVLAVPTSERFAVLLDAPRSDLLRKLAESSSRAPEEVLIDAIDRLIDDAAGR